MKRRKSVASTPTRISIDRPASGECRLRCKIIAAPFVHAGVPPRRLSTAARTTRAVEAMADR